MIELIVVGVLASSGILCTVALVWFLRRAARGRDRLWLDVAFTELLPDKLEPPYVMDEFDEDFEIHTGREIFPIMAELYPREYAQLKRGQLAIADSRRIWDACCAVHDARFEIERICS